MTSLTYGSLFSGIGGFDLGFDRAGMVCKWQVEIDPFCQKVLAKHWPNVKRFGDIRDVGKHNLEPVDVICGGFPCQPFSDAGQRRGSSDNRFLWPEMLRVVQELKPRWVVGENVTGFISLYLDQALIDLESQGYEAWAVVLPALAVDAPHERKRVFIIAYADWNEYQSGTSPVGRKATEVLPVAYPSIERCGPRRAESTEQQWTAGVVYGGSSLAYSDSKRQLQPQGANGQERGRISDGGQAVEDSTGGREREHYSAGGPDGAQFEPIQSSWWTIEPNVGRVAYGVPNRMDRLRALGNAVVPQLTEELGKRIVEAAK